MRACGFDVAAQSQRLTRWRPASATIIVASPGHIENVHGDMPHAAAGASWSMNGYSALVLVIGRAEIAQTRMRLAAEPLRQRRDDARFADPGFAGDQHDLAGAILGSFIPRYEIRTAE